MSNMSNANKLLLYIILFNLETQKRVQANFSQYQDLVGDAQLIKYVGLTLVQGGGPRVVVSMFLPHPRVKVSIVGSLRDREVACSASDR